MYTFNLSLPQLYILIISALIIGVALFLLGVWVGMKKKLQRLQKYSEQLTKEIKEEGIKIENEDKAIQRLKDEMEEIKKELAQVQGESFNGSGWKKNKEVQ